jgi:aspartyl-tRNA(Asn)/glutamyl-tRNA(Gln) amidotransferase subunit C
MALTKQDIQRIANLARLSLSETEENNYLKQVGDTLQLIAPLMDVNTDHIEDICHPMRQVQRLRDDSVTEFDQREKFQAIAPDVAAGLYLVPQVIES